MLYYRTLTSDVPEHLLREFFERHGLEIDVSAWGRKASNFAKAIKAAVANGAPGIRKRIETDLRTIARLSSETGQAAVQSIASNSHLAGFDTAIARSLWLLLHDRNRCERALDRLYFDEHRTPRQWSGYAGPKDAEPRLDPETIARLKETLRAALDTSNIHIDFFRFGPDIEQAEEDGAAETGQAIQLTIYSEDLPNAEHAFVEGALTTIVRARVIQAAAIYDPSNGTIECIARRKASREAIVREIGRVLFDVAPGVNPVPARRYDLVSLGKRRVFETDPRDRIESVEITMLRLGPLHSAGETLTLERASRHSGSIWDMADDHLGPGRLESRYRITRARIVIKYHRPGDKRLHALPVIITPHFGSNIKEQDEFERTVSEKYLTEWGLAEPK